ncbi:helix-turn-helix domain-containing protein [Sphingosinicella sp. BN140058]|uniref:helix-turn-helix domain-containing protein n=1 Tax=Sphingosinicella sp. BN140058 TaxID=1892855 RepID=UPI00101017F4|nr:helix-turn-helix transcriptional regulator [Sphingosinicella sp. BN140058]QAY75695.1 XRE family transcriptional regulator [Sphingosinicella sp. BN140058]
MITRIREVRRARRLTLQDVAGRCMPPTTPQTIGRLETGNRTVSVGWLNRIAAALEVEAGDLVRLPDREDVPVAAMLGADGAVAPRREQMSLQPRPVAGSIAIAVSAGIGDYRAGDQIWLNRVPPEALGTALNRDVLVPRPGGRFLFGRLIGRESGKLHILPLGPGQRQVVVAIPPWAGVAVTLIRSL